MNIVYITVGTVAFLALLLLLVAFICFYKCFFSSYKKRNRGKSAIYISDTLKPYKETFDAWDGEIAELSYLDVSVRSFDGLILKGKFYEYKKGAPIELMHHGYRGNKERDLTGGVLRAFKQGRSVLMVDNRGSGDSEGRIITFGINESKDCRTWVDFIINEIDKDARIILTGISMGAATVMIAAGRELPENVVGVIADCGYTCAKDIIMNTIKDMKLPPKLMYPFVKLGGRVFGGFDVDETSPVESLENCKLPIIFFHGDKDDFVPCHMSEENCNACKSDVKKLVFIEGAGHGVCYPANPDKYLDALAEFFPDYCTKNM